MSVPSRLSRLGPALYGALFVVVLPGLLLGWERALARSARWTLPALPWPGGLMAASGLTLAITGMSALVVHGEGLPMNAFPPRRFVTRGPYALVAHPIYAGTFLFVLGWSLALGSAPGVAIVSPVLGLMMLALVWGYERPALLRRFGDAGRQHVPLVTWPPADDRPATPVRRALAAVLWVAAWTAAGVLVDQVRHDPGRGAFLALFSSDPRHALVAVLPLAYFAVRVMSAPTLARLRHTLTSAMVWSLISLFAYVVVPALARDRGIAWAATSLLAALVAIFHVPVWDALRHVTEVVANSRRDLLLFGGRLRVISHATFAFAAGMAGAAVGSAVLHAPGVVLIVVACTLAGSALYAQLSWGSDALLRPFGFWGAVPGLLVAVVIARVGFGCTPLDLLLATTLAAPWAQAAGRLRCLAQGCCHGVPTSEGLGIRVWQPQSRVVVLSKLAGRWILPTQLFSILFNLVLGALLLSAWRARALSITAIAGLYFLLTGIERFVEDAYRGETQTREMRGLKEPQWIAIGSCVAGLLLGMVPSALPEPPAPGLGTADVLAALVAGGITALAMSVDFPRGRWRFSRLSG